MKNILTHPESLNHVQTTVQRWAQLGFGHTAEGHGRKSERGIFDHSSSLGRGLPSGASQGRDSSAS